MEQLYKDARTLERMRAGLLGAYVDAFARQLIDQGYARPSIRYSLQLVADFGRWLMQRRILVSRVTPESLSGYLRDRTRRGHFRPGDASILRRLRNLLAEQGIVVEDPPIAPTAVEQLETEFRYYLERERRLAPATVFHYLEFARRFLAQMVPKGEASLAHVQAADVVNLSSGKPPGFIMPSGPS